MTASVRVSSDVFIGFLKVTVPFCQKRRGFDKKKVGKFLNPFQLSPYDPENTGGHVPVLSNRSPFAS